MLNTLNKFLCPFSLFAVLIFTVTMLFAGTTYFNGDPQPITPSSNDTCILETHADTLAYIHEHIDQNDNGMPDDLENGTDTIYQIILDNQQAIEEISVDIDRINTKLDELYEEQTSR